MSPQPGDRIFYCPTKGCGFRTSQPRLVKAMAHVCHLNRDRLVDLVEEKKGGKD